MMFYAQSLIPCLCMCGLYLSVGRQNGICSWGRHTVPSVRLSSTALLNLFSASYNTNSAVWSVQCAVCHIKCAHCCFEHGLWHSVLQVARCTLVQVLRWVVSAITISPDVSGRKLGPRGGVSKVQGLGRIPHCWNCKTEDFVSQPVEGVVLITSLKI